MAYVVVLDANVLFSPLLRSLLIGLSQTGLFRSCWTKQIHEEWIAAVSNRHPEIRKERLLETAKLMNEAVRDCLIEGFEYLEKSLKLPDVKDVHVLAAAIHGKAHGLVTFNLKDFPPDIMERHNIEVIHPDDFLISQLDLQQATVLEAIRLGRQSYKNPVVSSDELIARLEKLGMPQSAARLRSMASLI